MDVLLIIVALLLQMSAVLSVAMVAVVSVVSDRTCAPCRLDGHLELHTLSLLPSQRQVVFRGDRLPFHCTAALVDKVTAIHWRHNGQLVTSDPDMGVQLESSVLHDCTFITR